MRATICRALAIGCALLVACDEDDSTGPPSSLTISPAAAALTVQATKSALVGVRLVRAGWKGVVSMEVVDVPTGVTAWFQVGTLPDHSNLALLNVQVGYAVLAGTYTIGIHANGEGVEEAKSEVTLIVTAPPSFALTLEPAAVTKVRGVDVTTTVHISRINGFDGAVTLTREGDQYVVFNSFRPNPAGGNTSIMTLGDNWMTGEYLPGTYRLTVRGTSPGLPEQTAVLTVTLVEP